jgi:hypothetical protein
VGKDCVQDDSYECPGDTISSKRGCVTPGGASFIPRIDTTSLGTGAAALAALGIVGAIVVNGPNGPLNPDFSAQIQSYKTNMENFGNMRLD